MRACFFMHDAHKNSETDRPLPDADGESPLPGWASTMAATTAAEAAAAPNDAARTNRQRAAGAEPANDHAG